MQLARAIDEAAGTVGVDFIGGYSALVQKGATPSESEFLDSIPEALSTTSVCVLRSTPRRLAPASTWTSWARSAESSKTLPNELAIKADWPAQSLSVLQMPSKTILSWRERFMASAKLSP